MHYFCSSSVSPTAACHAVVYSAEGHGRHTAVVGERSTPPVPGTHCVVCPAYLTERKQWGPISAAVGSDGHYDIHIQGRMYSHASHTTARSRLTHSAALWPQSHSVLETTTGASRPSHEGTIMCDVTRSMPPMVGVGTTSIISDLVIIHVKFSVSVSINAQSSNDCRGLATVHVATRTCNTVCCLAIQNPHQFLHPLRCAEGSSGCRPLSPSLVSTTGFAHAPNGGKWQAHYQLGGID